jgi:hypothetical protein
MLRENAWIEGMFSVVPLACRRERERVEERREVEVDKKTKKPIFLSISLSFLLRRRQIDKC